MESISTTYLDEALADFSGYLTIDEVYDGPFCILSVVDNRRYNRLAFRVLDHDPTQDDVRDFLFDDSLALELSRANPADQRPDAAGKPAGQHIGGPVDADVHTAQADEKCHQQRHAQEI